MNTPSPQNHLTDHETISWLAYQLWEYAGRPEGRATEFWPQAECLVGACTAKGWAVRTRQRQPSPRGVAQLRPKVRFPPTHDSGSLRLQPTEHWLGWFSMRLHSAIVTDAGVSRADDDHASTAVFMVQTTTSAGKSIPRVEDDSLVRRLLRNRLSAMPGLSSALNEY